MRKDLAYLCFSPLFYIEVFFFLSLFYVEAFFGFFFFLVNGKSPWFLSEELLFLTIYVRMGKALSTYKINVEFSFFLLHLLV